VTIRIREGRETDIEGVAKVHVQGWRESYKNFLSPEALAGLSVEERIQLWHRALTDSEARAKLLLAEADDGEIVGFIRGGPTRGKEADLLGTEAEIFAIYLLDKVKRQGIGGKLMAGVFDHLAAHGFRSVGLLVLKDNLPARSFYESLGGQPGPEQSFDVRGQMVTEVVYRFELTLLG